MVVTDVYGWDLPWISFADRQFRSSTIVLTRLLLLERPFAVAAGGAGSYARCILVSSRPAKTVCRRNYTCLLLCSSIYGSK
jgi:hypothetical protein